jgi:putative endonuclease
VEVDFPIAAVSRHHDRPFTAAACLGLFIPRLVLVCHLELSVISTEVERSRAVRRDSLLTTGGRVSKTYYVYMMASRSGTLYLGVTNDLVRRVYEHKHGVVPGFTSKYRVTRLVYCEQTNDVGAAIDREKQLKRWSRQKKMALVESVNPKWEDLGVENKSRLAARDPSTSVGMTNRSQTQSGNKKE